MGTVTYYHVWPLGALEGVLREWAEIGNCPYLFKFPRKTGKMRFWPHYHRKFLGEGGALKRHRPWEGW